MHVLSMAAKSSGWSSAHTTSHTSLRSKRAGGVAASLAAAAVGAGTVTSPAPYAPEPGKPRSRSVSTPFESMMAQRVESQLMAIERGMERSV